jgi:hypothetical protein
VQELDQHAIDVSQTQFASPLFSGSTYHLSDQKDNKQFNNHTQDDRQFIASLAILSGNSPSERSCEEADALLAMYRTEDTGMLDTIFERSEDDLYSSSGSLLDHEVSSLRLLKTCHSNFDALLEDQTDEPAQLISPELLSRNNQGDEIDLDLSEFLALSTDSETILNWTHQVPLFQDDRIVGPGPMLSADSTGSNISHLGPTPKDSGIQDPQNSDPVQIHGEVNNIQIVA